LHQNFNIHDTEEYQAGRNRARGSFKTPSFVDFKSFVLIIIIMMIKLLFHMLHLFLSITKISLQSVLNFDEANLPQGHCDYTATLELEPSSLEKA
jgi:uncharacterized protein YfdQ (DUF2303 family)